MLDDGAKAPVIPTLATPVTAASTTAATSARRVNAADKRIINGSTDVNQLVPFKYKCAWSPITDKLRKSDRQRRKTSRR